MNKISLTDDQVAEIYQKGYDDFAGPKQFRHASNYGDYHKAGLREVVRVFADCFSPSDSIFAPVIVKKNIAGELDHE
jgi:hypothetical protein